MKSFQDFLNIVLLIAKLIINRGLVKLKLLDI